MHVIYLVSGSQLPEHAELTLSRLEPYATEITLVAAETVEANDLSAELRAKLRLLSYPEGKITQLSGYRAGLIDLFHDENPLDGPVLLTGDHVIGPMFDLGEILDRPGPECDHLAAYYHIAHLDSRLPQNPDCDRIAYLDFSLFSPKLIADPSFRQFWENVAVDADYWQEFAGGVREFSLLSEACRWKTDYLIDPSRYGSAEPRLYEIHKILTDRYPIVPVGALMLDALLYDIYAIQLDTAVEILRTQHADFYNAAIGILSRNRQLRDISSIITDVRVLSTRAERKRSKWAFGEVGIFIHVYYVDMWPMFWELLQRVPGRFCIYVSTASEGNRQKIQDALLQANVPESAFDVRVVAYNRGRDMSSLFITFRDVILEDRHEVCLRLHSKQTPQVSVQIGESFRDHLFDNLVSSKGYISNLYDMLEREPDIGLVIPPTIHIGFGTLGHAWFGNREPLIRRAGELDLKVAIDEHTPLAPFGTMFWFRSKALKKMFAWEWKWGEYNPEPQHVDGGLAHVQERLISYVIQDSGHRVVSVMNPRSAERNYAKLEYKLQRLASYLPTGNVIQQDAYLSQGYSPRKNRLRVRLVTFYQTHVMTRPRLLKLVRPAARMVGRLLAR